MTADPERIPATKGTFVQCPNKCHPPKATTNPWLNCPRCGTRMVQISPAHPKPDVTNSPPSPEAGGGETYVFARNTGDRKFLTWIADRLVQVHGESEYVDYILTLRRFANGINDALRSPPSPVPPTSSKDEVP